MEHSVKVYDNNSFKVKKAEAGTNLLDFLRDNSINIPSHCGGRGTCGKCKIRVEGIEKTPEAGEIKLLGKDALAMGYRLACQCTIESDITIYLEESEKDAKIMTAGKEREIRYDPVITKRLHKLTPPDLEDQRSDLERIAGFSEDRSSNPESLTDFSPEIKPDFSLAFLRELPRLVRESDFNMTLVCKEDALISAEPGDTTDKVFAMAVDIGTTTIAAYLLDLSQGKRIGVRSVLNPQRQFGADVLSRVDYASTSPEHMERINKYLIDCINGMITYFVDNHNIDKSDIYAISFVGNTIMMHLLMKLPVKNIAVAPFIPATTLAHEFKSTLLGININPEGFVLVYPCVSGYIGADTVSAVMSSGMYEKPEVALMLDLGTNGEIALGNDKWLYACSTAAGPAFEGMNISSGMGGVEGAIDKVKLSEDFEYTTIGNTKARGICGSGIIDIIAEMLSKGIIDETGRIVDRDELDPSLNDKIKDRVTQVNGQNAYLLIKKEDCSAGRDITISQKDVRELQNAKAAVAAGIRTLIRHAGLTPDDVEKVYLTGGFGSYIDIGNTHKIGLLPKEFEGKVESIGNAAGIGAIEGLLSAGLLGETVTIRKRIKYVELSARPDFVEDYVECMMFE